MSIKVLVVRSHRKRIAVRKVRPNWQKFLV